MVGILMKGNDMQRRLRTGLAAGALGVALVLAGCASGADDDQQTDPSATEEHQGHGYASRMSAPLPKPPRPQTTSLG